MLAYVMQGYTKGVDWWSLGVVIYEIICGVSVTPFRGERLDITYQRILQGQVKFPPGTVSSIAKDLIRNLLQVEAGYEVKSHICDAC